MRNAWGDSMLANRSLPTVQRVGLSCFLLPLALACGGSRKQWVEDGVEDVGVEVDASSHHQILEGFGASVAWYAEWFTQHPNRAALSQLLFRDLGFDILRLRNQHRVLGDTPDPSGLDVYRSAAESLGHPPRVLLTSWAPPPELKASGNTKCEAADTHNTCSLRLNADGTFPYAEFAEYWVTSMAAYHAEGLDPYYVSLQNEPDFKPSGWEGCRFNETERNDLPGFDRALDAVATRFGEMGIETRIIGAETAQLQNGAALRYVSASNTSQLYGIAHHLYDGSTWKNPNGFKASMAALDAAFPNLPKFQTEFSPTESGVGVEGGFEVAWLIHNSIAEERASAYLHWELFWPTSGLVALSNPWDTSKWETSDGYRVLAPYYALKHFARYTEPDDIVVASTSNSREVLATAYLSPDATRLTIVVLNVAADPKTFTIDLSGFDFAASFAFVTTQTETWQPTVPFQSSGANEVQLEGRSIATYVVSTSPSTTP